MFSVTGRMKNFLDHVAYNCHRPKYFGKKAYLLSACTKWQESSVFKPLETWASGAGFTMTGKTYVEMLPFPLTEKILNKSNEKIRKAAATFYSQLTRKQELKPDFGSVMIFHVFRMLAKLAPHVMQADLTYFKQKRAYEKKAKWYLPAKISYLRDRFACFHGFRNPLWDLR